MPDLTHDKMASLIANILLERYRKHFGNVFIANIFHDFPRPDFIFLPLIPLRKKKIPLGLLSQAIAFEFKTPYVSKHEYITGIGQAVAYNASFPRSYLVIPRKNMEGFNVLFIPKIIVQISLKSIILKSSKTSPFKMGMERKN